MKPVYLKVATSPETSVDIRHDELPYFKNPWHFHPELELTLILKGTGSRFVGDNISPFVENELTLIGPNLPHLWRNDPAFYQKNGNLLAEAVVVRFSRDFAGKDFFSMPAMTTIVELLERSKRGMAITGITRSEVTRKMLDITGQQGARQVITLIEILDILADSNEYSFLSSMGFARQFNTSDSKRIDSIYNYILTHFRNPIHLEDVAEAANMNASAFCRYFKTKTGKTLVHFINEVRVGYACKLLLQGKYSLSEICYEVGFQSQSYFAKQFRIVTGQTPLQYRNHHRHRIN